MATIYVDSNAAGANDGTSFADAFTSLSSYTPSLGDLVLIASDHDETATVAFGVDTNSTSIITYVSVNSSTEAYEPGGSIASNGGFNCNNCAVFGLTLTANGNTDFVISGNDRAYFRECSLTANQFINGETVTIQDCVTNLNNNNAFANTGSLAKIMGGSFSSSNLNSGSSLFQIQTGVVEVLGVDLSGNACDTLYKGQSQGGEREINLFGCKLAASQTILGSPLGGLSSTLINTIEGEATSSVLQYFFDNDRSECSDDQDVTRTGGASDGETPYTLSLKAKAGTTQKSLTSAVSGTKPITIWVRPGNTNLRIYLAHNGVGSGTAGALQNNECWAVYMGPSEAVTADAALAYIDTRAEFGVSAADLTADSSTWSGTGVGTVQRIDIPIDPTEAGYAHVWLHLAPGSASDVTIHFDPKLEVS